MLNIMIAKIGNSKMSRQCMQAALAIAALIALTGCGSTAFSGLNPFDSSGASPESEYGQKNLNAVLGGGGAQGGESVEAQNARHALEVMSSYRQAQAPQPAYPVIQPAEVRLMWVPDHRTKTGDFVPAHYYYLKVMPDRWAAQDAFDLEDQLNASTNGSGRGSYNTATPWVYGDPGKKR